MLMSVAWGGGGYDVSGGDVARHEWKGLGKDGMKLEDVVEKEAVEGEGNAGRGVRRRQGGVMPGGLARW